MRTTWLPLGSLVLTLALLPTPVAAQDDWSQPWDDSMDRPPRFDISASVGVLMPSDWSSLVLLGSISSASGILEQVLVRDLRVEPNTEYAGAFTYWRGRYGFQVHGAFSNSTLKIGGATLPGTALSPSSLDVDTWLYEVRGQIGLLDYHPTRAVFPYAWFGLGGITYDLSQIITPPLLTFISQGPPVTNTGRETIIVDRGRQFVLSVDELGLKTVFSFSFGIGTDIRIPVGSGAVGLRLGLSDNMSESPLTLRISDLSNPGGLSSQDTVHFGTVHHLRAEAGFVVQIGR